MASLEALNVEYAPLKMLGPLFWSWYEDHQDDTWPIKMWIISVQIPLSKLRGLFERVFGLAPIPPVGSL